MLKPERTIQIDIPVRLTEVKAIFSIASLSFEGDLAASLFHMGLIVDDVADWNAKSEIIAVFHTNAGHVTLHDDAYNQDRNITTGNPYKGLCRSDKTGREDRTVWRHGEGPQLRKRGSTSRHQDQYRRHVENYPACSRRLCEDLRIVELKWFDR
jgi:hypothetical protein